MKEPFYYILPLGVEMGPVQVINLEELKNRRFNLLTETGKRLLDEASAPEVLAPEPEVK